MPATDLPDAARRTVAGYAALPSVEAVALGGSRATGLAGPGSDVDLYVYARTELPIGDRAAVALAEGARAEIDNRFFEAGDEWIDAASGLHLDAMFRRTDWIEDQLDRVLVRHEASVGYSTALWHNVRTSLALFDRSGWFAALQRRASVPYPEPLRRAILAKNLPLLRRNLSSFAHQIELSSRRADSVALNHRVAAFLASAFDVLFALNRVPHPGEKRLVTVAEACCPLRPPTFDDDVRALALARGDEAAARAEAIARGLEAIAEREAVPIPSHGAAQLR